MKTLKKSLCLILALVFVLGLCTVGAGAAFTDADEITYTEAVDVMADLGILVGMGDGKFAPTDNVTRAQAAKMITYMVLGATNAERLPTPASKPFNDVEKTFWGAKYINFCATKGIINGYGDGNFGPDDQVTGAQIAKMLLVALGYGEMNEYLGSGWDINAVTDAFMVGIYNEALTEDFGAPATREECALYVYNALIDGALVAYDVDYNVYDTLYVKGTNYESTYANKVWKLQNMTGIVIANKAAGDTATKIKLDGAAETTAFAADTGLDLIGHEVRVLYKEVMNNGVYTSVYAVTDISEVIPAYSIVGKLEKAATVNSIANYVVTPYDAYVAPDANTMIFNDLILFNGKIIGVVATESFSIAQVKSIDAKTGAYTLDDNTVTDKTWTLCDAAVGDYIEVVTVGANTITRATSKFENIKITQITNPSTYAPSYSYNNGQFVKSAAANVADYLDEAAAKLTLGNSYTFYKDSKGGFFRAEIYSAPAAKTSAVFFVKAFTIKGSDTYDEWGQTVGAKDAYYAQCVTAAGESVNYATKELYKGDRGPVSLSFDDKGNAILGTASDVEKIDGADWSKTAITKIPAKPYYLTSDATIIVLGQQKVSEGSKAELGNLKVTTSTGSIKGDFTGIDLYVAIPETTATAKDIQTIWIDGAAKAASEPEKPVEDSYIYVTDAAQVGQMLLSDGKTTVGTYNVYIDGVKTEIAMKAAPSLGFFAYTVKDGVYTLSTDSATSPKTVALNTNTTLYKGVFSSSDALFDGKSIAGMTVVDLRAIDPAKAVTDVAGLEKLADKVDLTVLMTTKGAFVGVIYVTNTPAAD